jgi:ssDNA-binding replication factor A large subunit
MKLKEVEAGKNVTELLVRVVSVAPPRMVKTRSGRKTRLTEVLVADESATTILSLWGFSEGEGISAGMVIKITDGWAKEWQGKVQLSLGRSGKWEAIDDDGSLPEINELSQHSDFDTYEP